MKNCALLNSILLAYSANAIQIETGHRNQVESILSLGDNTPGRQAGTGTIEPVTLADVEFGMPKIKLPKSVTKMAKSVAAKAESFVSGDELDKAVNYAKEKKEAAVDVIKNQAEALGISPEKLQDKVEDLNVEGLATTLVKDFASEHSFDIGDITIPSITSMVG